MMPFSDLDAIDRKILRRLQQNGRLTNQQLCEDVGLSPSPCHCRFTGRHDDKS